MDKKVKEKSNQSNLREPRAKTNRFGLKVPVIRMPHDDLIKPEAAKQETAKLELVESTLPSHTRQSRQTSHTRQTRQTRQSEIAPSKDFQKVPNSITKEAIPDGLFKQGKSKQLYDVLYSLTRGNIEPKRSVRISKSKLRKLAGIGSRVTFDSCIEHLEAVGLLKLTVFIGEHEGNEFEINLPEEISLPRQTSHTSHTSLPKTVQKLDRLDCLETSQTSQSLIVENQTTYDSPKTSLKTLKTIDDEKALARILEKLEKAATDATGSGLGKKDFEALESIFDLIIDLTTMAQTKTDSVSVYLKFAEANLRRRLAFARKTNAAKEKPFDPGDKSSAPEISGAEEGLEAFTPDPMSAEARENVLVIYRSVYREQGREAMENLRPQMTAEDFAWLIEKLQSES